MNAQQLEKKVRKDADQLKKSVITLMKDSASRFSKGYKKATDDARKTLTVAAASVQKSIGRGLSQTSAKTKKAAGKAPGGFAKTAAKYSWMAIAIALVAGILVSSRLIRPS